MLYPIQNNYRHIIDLNGLWEILVDPNNEGFSKNYQKGFHSDYIVAVPGSWNEQLEEAGLLHYVGTIWFTRSFNVPDVFHNKSILLRIDSIDFNSKVWINGNYIGENNFGFLPFEYDITSYINFNDENIIVIWVNNELDNETIPQGIKSETYRSENRLREETNPPARFDFCLYGGIHRPIRLLILPYFYIDKIFIDSKVNNENSCSLKFRVLTNNDINAQVLIKINKEVAAIGIIKKGIAEFLAELKNPILWFPENPYLYNLKIQLLVNNEIIDEYILEYGIRTVSINNRKIFINGKEYYLKGFGKHEDFSIIGRGLFLPGIVKDFSLLKWINANSFRTSHYPYAEEILYFADKKGILVIDEVPAVSLDFRYTNEKTLLNHKEFITRLIERDYNHSCVIIWSVGNEPNLVGANEYYNGKGREYWKEIFNLTKTLDPFRPVTVPNCSRAGLNDPVFEFCDIISINRYYGWYEYPADFQKVKEILNEELESLYKEYKKPILFTEFGADTLVGEHSSSLQMFTEEFQIKLLKEYLQIIRTKDFIIGEHIWTFADFRTPQHFRRVILNLKGVFTRERKPKGAAFFLKEYWENKVIQ